MAGGNLGNIYIAINAKLTKYRADLKKAEAMTRASAGQMDAAFHFKEAKKSLMGFNTLLVATFAGVGLMAAGRFAKSVANIGVEFEHSMLIVKGVTRATGQQFEDLTNLAKKLGETTEWTAQQAAGGLKFLGMAGLGAEKSLKALPGMLDLATAGAIDLAVAADIATNAMTAMQIPVDELGRVNDVFIATITRSNTNMEMMAESFKYAAPLAKAYGVSIEQLSAMIGTLGNAGIQGSMAGTQLAFAFQKTQKVFEALGMDGSGKSFVDALRAAKDAGWGANEMMSAFGMRGGRAALVLKDLIPMVDDLESKLKNSEGEAKKLAETMRSSTKVAFIELKSALEGVAIAAFTENTGGLKDAIKNLTKSVRDNKASFVEMGAVLVGITEGFADAASGAIRLKTAMSPSGMRKQTQSAAVNIQNIIDVIQGNRDWQTGEQTGELKYSKTFADRVKERKAYDYSDYSERERRRLGLDIKYQDTESAKTGRNTNSRATLTDMWATNKEVIPRLRAPDNPALLEYDEIADIKKYTDIKLELLDKEVESNYQTKLALTDMWAVFNDEQTQAASAASIAKAKALEEISKNSFSVMTELSERTAWAMQENFSTFFFSAMKGELTSFKDFAVSIFDTILKAFADMAAQMAVQKLFGVALGAFGGGGAGAALGSFSTTGASITHAGGLVGTTPTPKRNVPSWMFNGAPRLHGGLAGDEFPAILQRGETVIPKNGNAGGNMTSNVNINISATDAASFADMTSRNPEAIIYPIMKGIQEGNMPLIRALRGAM